MERTVLLLDLFQIFKER